MQLNSFESEVLTKEELRTFKKPSNFDLLLQNGKFQQIAIQIMEQKVCYQSNGIDMKFKLYKGQSCILKDTQTNRQFTVQISNFVITSFINNIIHLFVQTRLYYKKNDLLMLHKDIMEECSETDLFLTNISVWFYCPYIQELIFVKPIEDYIQGKYIWEENCFWVRSEYNALTNQFNLDQTKWKRECCCNTLCNPKLYEKDITYCKNCSFIFHIKCVKQLYQTNQKQIVICAECNKNIPTKLKNSQDFLIMNRSNQKK